MCASAAVSSCREQLCYEMKGKIRLLIVLTAVTIFWIISPLTVSHSITGRDRFGNQVHPTDQRVDGPGVTSNASHPWSILSRKRRNSLPALRRIRRGADDDRGYTSAWAIPVGSILGLVLIFVIGFLWAYFFEECMKKFFARCCYYTFCCCLCFGCRWDFDDFNWERSSAKDEIETKDGGQSTKQEGTDGPKSTPNGLGDSPISVKQVAVGENVVTVGKETEEVCPKCKKKKKGVGKR